MDINIPDHIGKFLRDASWSDAVLDPIDGDASGRRYFRVNGGKGKAILMDAPPPEEDPKPFLHVAKYLCAHDLNAPDILAADAEAGLVLLEDFGDRRMREHLDAHADDEYAIYREAIDTLTALHKQPPADCPPYDLAFYQQELALFTDWYCKARGLDVNTAEYSDLWDKALRPVLAAQNPGVTVLRDYHAENIMLLENGQGLLDFQDALVGHPAYDLVSLLQDARRDVSPALETDMLEYYCAQNGAGDDFRTAYHILGAQRNLKIIGIFVRLWQRDGKPRYLSFIPRVWDAMERDLQHPALVDIRQWFGRNIPGDLRDPSKTLGGVFQP